MAYTLKATTRSVSRRFCTTSFENLTTLEIQPVQPSLYLARRGMRCSASSAKNERKWADLLGPQNRPYRPTTTATATTAITGSARVASVGFHGVYELAVYANMDPIRSAYAKVPSRRAR